MKNKIITVSFLVIIIGLFFVNLIKPDDAVSYSERRRLAQFPELSFQTLMDGKFSGGFDKYTVDQFFLREPFRALKMGFDRNILQKLDTNGLFRVGEDLFSIEYPLREDKVLSFGDKMTRLHSRYLEDMNIYYSIIPDKNYYLPDDWRYLTMDYARLEELVSDGMPSGARYIELFDVLTLENYYNTDGHWRQETLGPVVDRLCGGMGVSSAFNPDNYERREYNPFYGAYYGQSAGLSAPDTLVWLENEVTRDAILTGAVPSEDSYLLRYATLSSAVLTKNARSAPPVLTVYNEAGLGGMDSYDVYLHGSQPLITMTNTHNDSGRELILFRDSFGSSLAPVLLENYSKVIVVDLRYIAPELLPWFIDFKDQDVLFMYSTIIINNSDIIR